ncbi:hypothetical protein AMATHDRAFT_65548 [Amanita thiersii Skay4041]|uniref:Uncharacterized protein n=1 Tax=Amanita thiersii Skay4041 TaxID=703135 RepID=A0A2A9NJK6_9AGAR|nr:hypothetical protein AMATHDRAFT_65548 [Amanita thiersii Skay4041]
MFRIPTRKAPQRHWTGYETISASNCHWSITFALQGSFDCPTPHMSFDLEHRSKTERVKGGRGDGEVAERPAVQPAKEGRWHVYHLVIQGREDEMKAVEEKQRRAAAGGEGGYDWHMVLLLHDSRPLNKTLVDKILDWQLSSPDHRRWFGIKRRSEEREAFFMHDHDWMEIPEIQGPHKMIFIGHPEQSVEDILSAFQKDNSQGGAKVDEKIFNHGCVLPKDGQVCAIKDDYGFVLVVHRL